MIKLSKQKITDYISKEGRCCPYCGCAGLISSGVIAKVNTIIPFVKCPECNNEWHDVYTLNGIIEPDYHTLTRTNTNPLDLHEEKPS